MAEAEKGSATTGSKEGDGKEEISLKDKGNEFFKAGNYLKAAALYTQAIKLDPSSPTLYRRRAIDFYFFLLNGIAIPIKFMRFMDTDRIAEHIFATQSFAVMLNDLSNTEIPKWKVLHENNRAAAFLQLVKLNKALADAETTITLNPQWEKGYFRKGCVLEAMEQYDNALGTFQIALQYNPQSTEVSRKIKRISQLAKDKKRAQEVESMRSNVNIEKHLETLKSEMSKMLGSEERFKEMFSFLVETMEIAVKSWHGASKVDPRVYFLLDKEKTQTDKYGPVVNIDKAFESPHSHGNCFSFLRQYAEDSFSKAACLVVPKNIISYPQVWKGQGSRKWRHGQHDGFFVQYESPLMRKIWFIASSNEKGQTLCRDPEILDISAHEVLPRLFKEKLPNP